MNSITYKKLLDSVFKVIVFIFTFLSVVSLAAILIFILIKAMPIFKEVNFFEFMFGRTWAPTASEPKFGVFAFIIASIMTTLLAILVGIPVGLYTAIYISEIAPKKIGSYVLFVIEMLAAIPSVVYGFFGLTLIVPFIQNLFHLSSGSTLLSASIILALMVLPTVVSLSTSSLQAVPNSVVEGSLALGATKIQTIFKTKIPYAKSGILTSFLLGLGRALGETMAVILVAGNSNMMPNLMNFFGSYLQSGRTLTGNIVMELAYATGNHESALFATGVVLFLFVSIINLIIMYVKKRGVSA